MVTVGDSIHYDKNWMQLPYLVVSRETAFEMEFLRKFDAEILIGQVKTSLAFKVCFMVKNVGIQEIPTLESKE